MYIIFHVDNLHGLPPVDLKREYFFIGDILIEKFIYRVVIRFVPLRPVAFIKQVESIRVHRATASAELG
jgi:hypothetical protein